MGFESKRARTAFAKRLAQLANHMVRARDQGYDGRYYPSDDDIEDIVAAAFIVYEAPVDEPVRGRERYSDRIFPVSEWRK